MRPRDHRVDDARGRYVTEGINAGDQVVISGAYLLNSEFTFRQGTDPVAGMEM